MSEQQTKKSEQPVYEPPQLVRHGKLSEITHSTTELPDLTDSTMREGERR
ncbi:MAG: lasso RiPP family leader peptide-containing protein [Ardenticatenaceae bacterium]|nr:lasso RiPP family leader peptide-containing protein [Ardenticatenaceae bacterium]HBY97000.1 hypothetical protein [Chloroflexota bacterium]